MNPYSNYATDGIEKTQIKSKSHGKHVIMTRRTPEQWIKVIATVDPKMIVYVSNIVWWDFFGSRRSKRRWNHLDDIINKPIGEHTRKEKVDALIKVGYARKKAEKRVI